MSEQETKELVETLFQKLDQYEKITTEYAGILQAIREKLCDTLHLQRAEDKDRVLLLLIQALSVPTVQLPTPLRLVK